MISKLSLIFGSKTKAQEIIFLLNKVKKVVRQGFYESELVKVEKFCEQENIHLVKSKFKVLLADQEAYSNKGIRIEATDQREGMYFVYLSLNVLSAWMASYHELNNNDYDLGILLGYPSCCVDFFCKRFSENNPNLQLSPKNPYTNLSKRNQDCVFISHFPCNSNCKESINLAKKYASIIARIDSLRAIEMINFLKR